MPHPDATMERLPPMNDPLIELLSRVTDARRPQAKRYVLANILLFCIFGFLCGAKSYKALCSRGARIGSRFLNNLGFVKAVFGAQIGIDRIVMSAICPPIANSYHLSLITLRVSS